ncbi:MAG: acyl-CoA thioesterase II [Salibacteraceae bacterium]|jgi:acyl-CoA thioesterase II|nr:acyl-CoA thioesterase II [Salibacteraceae bacterium]
MNNALIDLIELEKLDENLFRGQNFPAIWGTVFGGQVLAQSLNAARRTVDEDRVLHSMHCYFILPGKLDSSIFFHVDRIRDGKSFTTRRVVAVQNGRPIFNMSCSFQIAEEGFEHNSTMPNVPHHSQLKTDIELYGKQLDMVPPSIKNYLSNRYFHFKPIKAFNPFVRAKSEPIQQIWVKSDQKLPDNQAFHREALAFVSDFNLMLTGLMPHRDQFDFGQVQTASLDHAMWFHHDFRVDEWLLFTTESPNASNGRGLNFGHFYNEKGDLVASTAQEGLMRMRK